MTCQVATPKVITKLDESGNKLEPFEDAVVEVPEVRSRSRTAAA